MLLMSEVWPSATISDFEENDLTPNFEYYADDEDGFEGTADETLPPKLLPPTPEADDNYVGAELLLPRGD